MLINALNSGATGYMADFEDSNAPTWENMVEGQANLREAVRRTLTFSNPDGREYRLNDTVATLLVRPRGWHLVEKHLLVDGAPISASLFDFGLFTFHNAQALQEIGSNPYFYLPKMQSHLEARLWNDVFDFTEETLGLTPRLHPRHRAHRDAARGVRDGGDPLRAAHPLGRARTPAAGTTSSAR